MVRREPIAITGLGARCALGSDVEGLRRGLREGRSGIAPLSRFAPPDFAAPPVGQVAEMPGGPLPETHRLAIVAAREALAEAFPEGLPPERRVAVVLGTTTGGVGASEAWFLDALSGRDEGRARLRRHSAETVGRAVARALGLRKDALRLTLSTACSSGAHALMIGADLLAADEADVVLAGGADALCRLTLLGFTSLRLASSEPCRPFDTQRDGLNLGEAGAFLVLERRRDAVARGARAHAFLVGAGCSCDAHHMTAPEPTGAAVIDAIRQALGEAARAPGDIAYINAHGTATPANDVAEASALCAVFRTHGRSDGRRPPPVSASKSFIGHTLGAAGAIEAVITVLAVRDGFLPPTLTTTSPMPEADFDLVLGAGRDADVPAALSTSFAFGGNNAALVFTRDFASTERRP